MFMEWMRTINFVQMSYLPNLVYAIPIKIPARHFVDIDKLILKFTRRANRLRTVNTIMKKNKSWRTDTT